jgi:circadian clock protein KaiC
MTAELGHAGTGIAGLNEILRGGYQRERLYLIAGNPGTGKTTLALQFVLEGVRLGEKSLYVSLSETKDEIYDVARAHGWAAPALDDVRICEMQAPAEALDPERQYTFFHPSEVELGEAMKGVLALVDETKATRIVFDSLAELRLLARESLPYRRQVLALKQFLSARRCTTLLLDAATTDDEFAIDTIAHGVVKLEHLAPEYGGSRRRLRLTKVRAEDFKDGYHDYAIRGGGLQVFPRLVADEATASAEGRGAGKFLSDVAALDAIVGGEIERGTSTLVVGPSGVGKSTLTSQYAHAAVKRGERCAVFLFDERRAAWLARTAGLGMNFGPAVDDGRLTLEHVNPAALSPGEFAHRVRLHVEERAASVIIIDSLNGYEMGMPGERHLALHLNEMAEYLNQRGVNALMTLEQHGLVGDVRAASAVTYIADNVILLRYFEAFGEVRRAMSVIKKRMGAHERLVREFSISSKLGLAVGAPLRDFNGVLTGTLTYVGPPRGRPPSAKGERGGARREARR